MISWKKVILLLVVCLLVVDLFGQCAMCRAVAEEGAAEEPTNINRAIIYIMIIPYIILFIAFRKKIFGILKAVRDIPQDNKR